MITAEDLVRMAKQRIVEVTPTEVAERLHRLGVRLMFSGLKHQVRRLLEHGGVVGQLGRDAFFPDKETALLTLLHDYGGADDRSGRDLASADMLPAGPRA